MNVGVINFAESEETVPVIFVLHPEYLLVQGFDHQVSCIVAWYSSGLHTNKSVVTGFLMIRMFGTDFLMED